MLKKLRQNPRPRADIKSWDKDDWKKVFFSMDFQYQQCLKKIENLKLDIAKRDDQILEKVNYLKKHMKECRNRDKMCREKSQEWFKG